MVLQNMDLLRSIEGIRNPVLDTFFELVTRFGEEMILIVVFCALFWCIDKRKAYVLGVVFFMSSLVVQGMKIVFRVPRPWVVDSTFQPVGGSVRMATGYAFPSGHTQNAAALWGSLGAQFKAKWFKIICFTMALLVGLSRLYLGVHFIEDVVVALAVTFIILAVAMKFVAREEICIKRELIISGVIVAIGIAVLIYAAVSYHGQLSESYQLRDSTRAAGAAIAFALGMFIERVYIQFSVKSKNIGWHILKFVIGIGVTLAIQEIFRFIANTVRVGYEETLVIDSLRYFAVVIWIMVCYPLIIKKFFAVKED